MTAKRAFFRWAFIGAFLAAALLIGQANEVGGAKGLLQVGEASTDIRPIIEGQLGPVPLAKGSGHDGQIYYVIALDLRGGDIPQYFFEPGYRYRRILYPALSSAFGLLDGQALLVGMIAVTILSAALAAGSTAAVAVQLGMRDWAGLSVVLNPGMWLSIRLLTADTTAIALMVTGLAAFLSHRMIGRFLFGLSSLAKEVFLITPLSLLLEKHEKRWLTAAIPVGLVGLWSVWLTLSMGGGLTPRGNLSLPLVGIFNAAANWFTFQGEEWFYLVFALLSVLIGLVAGIAGGGWLRWPILSWSVLGLVSSNWVWDFGNNAARVLAPLLILLTLHLGGAKSQPLTDDRRIKSPPTETGHRT